MQTPTLCQISFALRDDAGDAPPVAVGGATGIRFGSGDVSGERLAGSARLVEVIRRRADGIGEVTLNALITTAEGAAIVLRGEGRLAAGGSGPLTLTLEAQDERYRWLNALPLLALRESQPGGAARFTVSEAATGA